MAAKKFMAKAISAFMIVCVLTATDPAWSQNLGEIARQERARRAAQSRPTRVITNEDLQRDKIFEPLMPEDRTVVRLKYRYQPGRVLNLEQEAPFVAVRIPDALISMALAPYTQAMAEVLPFQVSSAKVTLAQRSTIVEPVANQPVATIVQEPIPPATVIPWPATMSLGEIARFYQNQKQVPTYQEASPRVSLAARMPAPTVVPARQLPLTMAEPATPTGVIQWPSGTALGDVARFYQEQKEVPKYQVPEVKVTIQERPSGRILATTNPMPKSERLPEAPANVIQWPVTKPLGDIARHYQSLKDIPEYQEPDAVEVKTTEGLYSEIVKTAPVIPLASIKKEILQNLPTFEVVEEVVETVGSWVRVERGDSLWKLAQRYLGDGKAWQQIADVNPQITNPHHILAGDRLWMPMKPQVVTNPDAESVKVQSGDSLWKLAATRIGDGNAWLCIVTANPEISDTSKIYPGQVLIIPTSCDSSN